MRTHLSVNPSEEAVHQPNPVRVSNNLMLIMIIIWTLACTKFVTQINVICHFVSFQAEENKVSCEKAFERSSEVGRREVSVIVKRVQVKTTLFIYC